MFAELNGTVLRQWLQQYLRQELAIKQRNRPQILPMEINQIEGMEGDPVGIALP
jgi:hypothetical protein